MENIMNSEGYAKARTLAEELLKKMTLTEKTGQLSQFGTSIYSDNEQHFEDHFSEGRVGSYLTIKGTDKTNTIQKNLMKATRLPIPALFADDVIHGYRTTFPTPITQSCTWDPELTRQCNEAAAKEAYRAGLRWAFAPMVDIARDPRWGRIMEGYGEDTYLCSKFAAAAVRGYQGDGETIGKDHIMACMKHYAAYGAGIGGRDYNAVDMSVQTLHDVYLPPFKAGIDAGAATVMSAFNSVNGVPATGNRYLLKAVLRDEFGFKGAVISDAGAIHELIAHGYAENEKDAADKAFNAGVDIVMAGDLYNDRLPELLKEGKVTMESIDESVLRVLTLKFLCGLMDEPLTPEDTENCDFCDEHINLARKAGAEGIVLLENDGTLPVKGKKKILIAGPLGGEKGKGNLIGGWSCLCDPGKTVSIYDGLKKAMPDAEIVAEDVCPVRPSEDELQSAGENIKRVAANAKNFDLIIAAVGENAGDSGEAASMSNLHLPGVQTEMVNELISTGKPVVLLVSAGRPLVLTDFKGKAAAIVYVWQPGTAAGDSIADVLTGKISPSGRLTTSFPYSEGQIPVYYNHTSTGRPALGHWRFESKYMDCPIEPLYPFGYGLSYTAFEINNVKLSKKTMPLNGEITVTADVKNTGDADGAEVVQLYVRDIVGSVVRPVKELKGFKKIYIPRNETKSVEFVLKASDLAFTDSEMNFKTEPGAFKLWVAENSADTRNEFDFTVTSENV